MKSLPIIGAGLIFGFLTGAADNAAAWTVRTWAGIPISGSNQVIKVAAPDTSSTPKTAIERANVEVFQTTSSGTTTAKACSLAWAGTAVTCSAGTTSSAGTGHRQLALTGTKLSAWSDGAAFGYVQVTSTAGVTFNGVYYSNVL